MMSLILPRVLGALTLGYGGYTLVRPQSLARASGLVAPNAPSTGTTRAIGRLVGTRDVLSGLAMISARAGIPLQAALIARVGCDLSDAVGLGSSVPKASRLKVLAITTGWAGLCALSLRWAGRKP